MGDRLHVRLDPAAVASMLRSPGGPVGRELARTAAKVQYTAKALAPKGMRPGITAEMSQTPSGPEVRVVSTHPATLFVINGTKPHQIRPRRAKALRFSVGGATVYALVVNHPGTKPNDFLGKALLAWRI